MTAHRDYIAPLTHTTGSTEEQPRWLALRGEVMCADRLHDSEALDAPMSIPCGSTYSHTGRHVTVACSHIPRPDVTRAYRHA